MSEVDLLKADIRMIRRHNRETLETSSRFTVTVLGRTFETELKEHPDLADQYRGDPIDLRVEMLRQVHRQFAHEIASAVIGTQSEFIKRFI